MSLRQAPHTLSAEGEDLLAAAAQPLGQPPEIYSTLTNADLPWPTITIKGKKHVLDQEGYVALRTHPDPEVRAQVFKTFWTALKAFERSIVTVYAGQLKSTAFQAKARHYPSSMSMILGAYNTPEQVYRTLVAETNAGLPTLHRYFKLMKKTLAEYGKLLSSPEERKSYETFTTTLDAYVVHHAAAVVDRAVEGRVEARPPRARLVLRAGLEQGLAAAGAGLPGHDPTLPCT